VTITGNAVMSWQMTVAAAYLRLSRRRGYATLNSATARLAAPKDDSTPPAKLRRQGRVARTTIAGNDVYAITPSADRAGAQWFSLIYVNGGAYVGEIQKQPAVAGHAAIVSSAPNAFADFPDLVRSRPVPGRRRAVFARQWA
jgi:hypothetical protein